MTDGAVAARACTSHSPCRHCGGLRNRSGTRRAKRVQAQSTTTDPSTRNDRLGSRPSNQLRHTGRALRKTDGTSAAIMPTSRTIRHRPPQARPIRGELDVARAEAGGVPPSRRRASRTKAPGASRPPTPRLGQSAVSRRAGAEDDGGRHVTMGPERPCTWQGGSRLDDDQSRTGDRRRPHMQVQPGRQQGGWGAGPRRRARTPDRSGRSAHRSSSSEPGKTQVASGCEHSSYQVDEHLTTTRTLTRGLTIERLAGTRARGHVHQAPDTARMGINI